MGYELQLEPMDWSRQQQELQQGRRDIAWGAFRNAERERYAYFSAPYRTERVVFHMRAEDRHRFEFSGVDELIRTLESAR